MTQSHPAVCWKIALVLLITSGSALAQVTSSPPPQLETRLKARIDAAVAKTAGANKTRGGEWNRWLIVGGIDGGTEGVYYYTADAAKYGTPDASSAFRIGSLTKLFTATLLALQEGQGMTVGPCGEGKRKTAGPRDTPTVRKTELSEKLSEACGSGCAKLPPPRDRITIEQLATHRSGLPHGVTVPVCSLTELFQSLTSFQITPETKAKCIAGEDPRSRQNCDPYEPCFKPGRKFLYSNWGFYTLGPLLAHNAGYTGSRDYDDLNRDKFLTPYGMTHTFGGHEDTPPKTARASDWACLFSYGPTNERYLVCPDQPHAYAGKNTGFPQHGSGHLWSTGPDMLQFLRFAMGRRAHKSDARTLKAMADARKLIFCDRADARENDDDTPGKIGLEWRHNKIGADFSSTPDELLWWKGGGAGSFQAYIGFSEKKNVGVFVLANTAVDDPGSIGKTFLGSY